MHVHHRLLKIKSARMHSNTGEASMTFNGTDLTFFTTTKLHADWINVEKNSKEALLLWDPIQRRAGHESQRKNRDKLIQVLSVCVYQTE